MMTQPEQKTLSLTRRQMLGRMKLVAVAGPLVLAFSAGVQGGQPKVRINHKGKIIEVAEAAVEAHCDHGDTGRACGSPASSEESEF